MSLDGGGGYTAIDGLPAVIFGFFTVDFDSAAPATGPGNFCAESGSGNFGRAIDSGGELSEEPKRETIKSLHLFFFIPSYH